MRSHDHKLVRTTQKALILASALAVLAWIGGAGTAEAGVSVGISIGTGGFAFGLGYSDYPVYSPAWSQPGFSFSFQTTLAGYGQWIMVPGMGSVWRPWVAPGWRPYTWGRWVATSYGWTWVAYEPWGYVPHHYGSWAMTSFGWVWVPGYVYHPANVTWVGCGQWIGWYPTPPPGWSQAAHAWNAGYRAGRFDGYRRGYDHGYADGWRDARYANFVRYDQMTADNIANVATPGNRFRELRSSRLRVLGTPPSRVRVQRAVGHPIPTIRVSERMVSMDGRTVRAVRPLGVERSIAAHSRVTVRRSLAPSVVRAMETGRRHTERSPGSSRAFTARGLRPGLSGRTAAPRPTRSPSAPVARDVRTRRNPARPAGTPGLRGRTSRLSTRPYRAPRVPHSNTATPRRFGPMSPERAFGQTRDLARRVPERTARTERAWTRPSRRPPSDTLLPRSFHRTAPDPVRARGRHSAPLAAPRRSGRITQWPGTAFRSHVPERPSVSRRHRVPTVRTATAPRRRSLPVRTTASRSLRHVQRPAYDR